MKVINDSVINPVARLAPMFEDAITRLSFGLDIVGYYTTFVPLNGPTGMIPAVCCVYQAKGKLIGPQHNVGNMSFVTNWFADQDEVDKAITDGMESLRAERMKQGVVSNGIKKGPIDFNPKEN
jgi:hypothetical protein